MKALRPWYVFCYHFILFLSVILVPILFPIRCFGKENLRGKKGFVLAINHPGSYDGYFVIVARGFGKKMLAMGKPDLFGRNRKLDFFWNIAGLFPAVKGKRNREVLDMAVEEVKKGRGLMIFPEGYDTRDLALHRMKSGAFVVAMNTGADMIPCRIGYEAGRLKMFSSTTVVFGKPITLEELGLQDSYSPAKLRAAKQIFTQRLNALYAEYEDVLQIKGAQNG